MKGRSVLRKNLVANYCSQIYVIGISIVLIPVYIGYMGIEAYALIGIFAVLQTWLALLDAGITPTITREASRHKVGEVSGSQFRYILGGFEKICFVVGAIAGLVLASAAPFLARSWFKTTDIPIEEIETSIVYMAAIIALRLAANPHRGVIIGFENQVWLSKFVAVFSTLRFVGVLVVLAYIGSTPEHFFGYQAVVALLETTLLILFARRQLPEREADEGAHESLFKTIASFGLVIAFTNALWVGVTQTDKLVLSAILPLKEYGYFVVAIVVTSGITAFSTPMATAILPRLSSLVASNKKSTLISVYRDSTQFAAVLVTPIVWTLVLFSHEIILLWTADIALTEYTAPIVKLYAAGNGLMIFTAFAYYLQFAYGNLRLHVVGSILYLCLLAPLSIWAASTYGGVGAGVVWLSVNIVYALFWVALVHRVYLPGIHTKWILEDILPVVIPVLCVGLTVKISFAEFADYFHGLPVIGLAITLMGITSILSSKTVRRWLSLKLSRVRL